MAKVLVIGSGGREHALAWKLSESSHVQSILVNPGNGGTMKDIHGNKLSQESSDPCNKISNVSDIPSDSFESLAVWCKQNEIGLVVVGPEVPLADGICDVLTSNDIKCFGPTSAAATLEASKEFAKKFMVDKGIPTARFQSFKNAHTAIAHINEIDYNALVVKASGLAAGKGVMVCETATEACEAVEDIFQQNLFGSSGDTLVVEERLYGEEFSLLCFTDGENIAVMPPVQDHKQVYEGDKGPNTGGMGAYGPCPQMDSKLIKYVKDNVLQVAVDGMRNDGKKYVGVLYAGIMITKDGPRVLEFNCRFGDPECQVLMSLLKSDLYEIMVQCCDGNLSPGNIHWKDETSVCIVLASVGYPGSYEKGKIITGINKINEKSNLKVFEAGTKIDANGDKVTSGGRVLSVCSTASNLEDATKIALVCAEAIKFEGSFYRKDIGWKGLEYIMQGQRKLTYESCGVSVSNGDAFVHKISSMALSTARKGCTAALGGFGALFDLAAAGYSDPVLVSGTDGVGTKLLLAQENGQHSTVGQDLVAMCVNDVLTHNAEPLYFLDYISCGKLKSKVASEVIQGISEACKLSGCGLIGGETAEMPGMYQNGDYDLAGFAVGAYDKKIHRALPALTEISEGNVIIGVSSNGLHSNGFSLVRAVVKMSGCNLSRPAPFDNNRSLLDCLLTPTAIYTNLLPVFRFENYVKAAAHITGGGIIGNLSRVIPDGMCAIINAKNWKIQPVFGWLANVGQIDPQEMLKTFNCGLGMCFIVAEDRVNSVLDRCKTCLGFGNLKASVIGYIEKSDVEDKVIVNDFSETLKYSWMPSFTEDNDIILPLTVTSMKPNVAVFISGSGTNMQALIDHANTPSSSYVISLVICNKASAGGLKKASAANIPYIVLDHKNYPTREAYDHAVHEVLIEKEIHFICLAGFMRLLSGWFTRTWRGRIVNIHPSLLPSFKGMDAHHQVLKAGVKITGCTVHFVTENMDEGAIIAQTAVQVEKNDDLASLTERVKSAEHATYPEALDLVASGHVRFDPSNNKVLWVNK